MERTCIIKLMPDSDTKADIQTGNVSNIEILDMLLSIQSHFAKALIQEYVDITGDKNISQDKMESYMEFLRNHKKNLQ